MQEVILFIMSFIFIFLIYQFFLIIPAKKAKNDKKKKSHKERRELVEINYLVKRYRLDMDKVNYNQLLQIVGIVSSFDISLIVSIIVALNNFLLEVVLGFVVTLLIIIVSYHLVYLFYKKKGMIINDRV